MNTKGTDIHLATWTGCQDSIAAQREQRVSGLGQHVRCYLIQLLLVVQLTETIGIQRVGRHAGIVLPKVLVVKSKI